MPVVSVMVTMVLLKEERIWAAAALLELLLTALARYLLELLLGGAPFCPWVPLMGRIIAQAEITWWPSLPADGLLGTLAGTGVLLGALTAHRQSTAVPDASVAADLDEAL